MPPRPYCTRKWLLLRLALTAAGLHVMSWGSVPLAGNLGSLPVPAITIYPGDVIKDEWLKNRDFPGEAGAAVTAREALVGKVARRTLLPGVPVPPNAVAEPHAVANGAKVRILYEDGNLAITAFGAALQAGSAGEVISVRNLSSGLIISGTVQADGSVHVGGS
jgi:flagella basal body P-ring formation protein FlgA